MTKEKIDKKSQKKEKTEMKKLKKEVLSHKKEIQQEHKKRKISKKEAYENSPEPTLFHYIVVLLVFGLIFGGIYYAFELYDKSNDDGAINNPNLKIKLYKYPFIVNGVDYSIQFYNPVSELEKSDINIGISKEQLLNTQEFYFVFSTNLTNGGHIAKTSGRLFPFLKHIYQFPLDTEKHIITSDNLTCEDSTLDSKLIFFNPNHTSNEVTFNTTNGCIEFKTTDATHMGTLGDKFFLEIINQ